MMTSSLNISYVGCSFEAKLCVFFIIIIINSFCLPVIVTMIFLTSWKIICYLDSQVIFCYIFILSTLPGV